MSKRPPYLEVIVTALVMTFLTLIVIGGINPRGESFDHVTIRTAN